MDETKNARILKCRSCEEYRNSGLLWEWPRCKAEGYDPKGLELLEMDDLFYEGPETNCPKGSWKDLPPVPIVVPDAEAQKEAMADRFVRSMKPMLDRIAPLVLVNGLAKMIEEGLMAEEIAVKVAARLDINLDTELSKLPTTI